MAASSLVQCGRMIVNVQWLWVIVRGVRLMYIQGPPANRAIWQRRFSICSVSGEGE